MGKDAQVRASLPGGPDEGRLQYEPPKLLFRGAERRVYEGAALSGVRAEGPDLVLADGSRFTLGDRQAAGWADAILNPKGRLDKLGVKPGQRAAIANLDDPDFAAELAGRVEVMDTRAGEIDLLFYGADSPAELAAVAGLIPRLGPKGALWIVS